ncbi:hypothetical protein [Myxosarcina sp. GI1(2024)]
MKIKLAKKLLVATLTSFILVAPAANPLASEEPLEDSEYPYCCQQNRSGWHRGRYGRSYDLNQSETFNGEIVSIDTYGYPLWRSWRG